MNNKTEFTIKGDQVGENMNTAGITFSTGDISQDPDFQNLRVHFEQGSFEACKQFLFELKDHYPQHAQLRQIEEMLEIKLSLEGKKAARRKEEINRKRRATINLGVFAIVCTFFTMITFLFSYFYLNDYAFSKQQEIDHSHITALHHQIEQLLIVGKPKTAVEVLDKIRLIDPRYQHLQELSIQIYEMLVLEVQYQSALDLVTKNQYDEALRLLEEIQIEKPGLWDVSQLITTLENTNRISEFVDTANYAYQSQAWTDVITAYENALFLEPNADKLFSTEEIVTSYLQNLIENISHNPATTQEIEAAEQDLEKATTLISQSEDTNKDIEDLINLSEQLLVHHYSQIARNLLEDKNQSTTTISKAITNYRKAINFMPQDPTLVLNLQNTRYYQMGTRQFSNGNWQGAIHYLSLISSSDPDFASENVNILLYESYYALGKEHYLAGRHEEADTALENAEIMAFDVNDNLIKLFQVKILSGDNAEKQGDHEQAAHYYQSALEAIQVTSRLTDYSILLRKYDLAKEFMFENNFEKATKEFQELLKDITPIYHMVEVEITNGTFLALLAHEYGSTVKAITELNTLDTNPIVQEKRMISVPIINE